MAKGGAGKQNRKRHKGVERASQTASALGVLGGVGKQNRRNQAKQLRAAARAKQLAAHRAASGAQAPPKVVAIVGAGGATDTAAVVGMLQAHDTASTTSSSSTSSTIVLERSRITLLLPARNIGAVLDAGKAADVLLLVIPADGDSLDPLGEQLVDALCMQGVGAVVGVLQGVEALPQSRRSGARRQWAASLEQRFPKASKCFSADLDPAGAALARHLVALTPRQLTWRTHASYMLAHSHTYTPDAPGSAALSAPLVHAAGVEGSVDPAREEGGVAVLYGYVRGLPMSIDRAIHVPGVGDVMPQSIRRLPDPHALRSAVGGGGASADGMPVDVVPGRADAGEELVSSGQRMTLTYEAEGDGVLAGEQTWPTAEELAEAEADAHEGGGGGDDDDEDGDEGAGAMEADETAPPKVRFGFGAASASAQGRGGVGTSSAPAAYEDEAMMADGGALYEGAADMDDDELDRAGAEGEGDDEVDARRDFLARRAAREEDAKFPDEVDTPLDVPARQRFARYRGLKSWRSSPWNPKENLPAEYGQIYHLPHWTALQRHALKAQARQAEEHPESVAAPGAYVAITVRVPASFAHRYGADGSAAPTPLVVCGVNTYESHLSVAHFSFSLSASAEELGATLKSKQPLIFRCGFRTFRAAPLFSEDTRRADKHKLERYVQPRQQMIASMYAPAFFSPAPMLAFLPPGDADHARLATNNDDSADAADALAAPATVSAGATALASMAGGGELGVPVGCGALLAIDADRVIVKKILITGAPFRCQKRRAVVRWMFFEPEDIRWFKPVELHTKMGRKGAIRESLGTHGYMKCIFDGVVSQHDTVCMSLYKRAFPKWRTFTYRL